MSITVLSCSHHKRERNSFHQVVENGFGSQIYLFVHFILPAIVIIDGVEQLVDSDGCIIYTPGQRQEYKHYEGVFLNDFLIFQTNDPDFITRYNLPKNEIFYVSKGDEITWIMEKITYSVTDNFLEQKNKLQERVLKLFDILSDQYVDNNPSLKRVFEIKQRFIALRDEIRENPKGWSVDQMAKKVWFTRSRFTVLYSEFFNISPNADLINFKIEYAKKLLETTDRTVSEISAMCGYTSAEHFIRIFNKQVKYTPLQYRKKYKQKLL